MDDRTNNTGVTQIIGSKDSKVTPLMSYSAITTHSEMALAFVDHILNYCHNLIPEKKMTAEDLITICHAALQRKREINILEGKYLRGRIAEQLSRAKRYGEPFSIMSLKLKAGIDDNTYDTLLDSLRERLRTSDIIFMFKNTIMIMLPHTDQISLNLLVKRLNIIINIAFSNNSPVLQENILPFPNPSITKASQVYDWSEDQLR